MKWLLSILVLVLGFMWWKSQRREDRLQERDPTRKPSGGSDATPSEPTAAGPRPPQAMIACAHCGVHLPAPEATLRNGQSFCTEAHARLHQG